MQQPARHMTSLDRFHDQPWADDARCAEIGGDLWFPEKEGTGEVGQSHVREAKAICQGCPVREQCLAWALDTDQRFGVWGGHSPRERAKLPKPELAATGTDGPSYDAVPQADDIVDEQPAPKSYGLAYVGGTSGHRPVPLATDIGVRPAHTPKTARATGLDWSKHTAPTPEPTTDQLPVAISWPCRGCGQKSGELVKDLCPSCRDAADAKFTVPGPASTGDILLEQEARASVALDGETWAVDTIEHPAPAPGQPAYVDDIVAVMLATEGHPDPTVRAARKVVANALVDLHKTLAGVFPHTPAAAVSSTRTAAAGPTPKRKPRKAPAGRRGPRGNPQTEAAIVRLYTGDENLSCPQIAERLNIGVKAVRSALDRAGIERTDGRTTHSGGGNRVDTYPDELVAAIRTRYLDHHMTQAEVAADLEITVKVVQSVMAKHHIPARPAVPRNPRSVLTDPAQLDELCARYQAGESGNALAKAYGVSLPTILDRLRGRGVTIRTRGGHHPAPSTSNPSGATTA